MRLLGTNELETDRLLLRKMTLADATIMYERWASLEDCTKYFPWPPASDPDAYQTKVANWINNYDKKDYFQWLITFKDTGEVVGIINLHDIDEQFDVAETSYILTPSFWGKGIMTEALKCVIAYGFDELLLNRISADVFDGNIGSTKVLTKCGMIQEGIAKERYKKDGTYIDALQFAILKSEYKSCT